MAKYASYNSGRALARANYRAAAGALRLCRRGLPRSPPHDAGRLARCRMPRGTGIGGTSFLLHVRHPVAAIRAGYARTILITHGESGGSRVSATPFRIDAAAPAGQFESPYGTLGPTTTFTIPALRYMKETWR